MLTLVVTNLNSIYTIMPNGRLYDDGYYIVIVLGLAKLMDMTFSLNGEIMYLSKYYWSASAIYHLFFSRANFFQQKVTKQLDIYFNIHQQAF